MSGIHVVGPVGAPLLVLSPSLGTTGFVWSRQMEALRPWVRVLVVELPGHGGAPLPGAPPSVSALGELVLAAVREVGAETFSFAGVSLGGLVGMWLAANFPGRLERLVVCSSRPRFEPSDTYTQRAESVRNEGTGGLVQGSLSRWFTDGFLAGSPAVADRFAADLSGVSADGYAWCCEVVGGTDLRSELDRITAPTLVVSAAGDPVVPPAVAAQTMAAIPGACLRVLAGGRHLANFEEAEELNAALLDHVIGTPAQRGLAERRSVLGSAHVERSLSGASALTRPFQDMLARWPWGEIWARPGLDRHTRRLVTIAMLVALNRPEELSLHLRAAMEDGASQAELEELLLHSAVYAGVPAANAAFAVAERVRQELEG